MYIDFADFWKAVGKHSFTYNNLLTLPNITEEAAKSGIYRLKKEGKIMSPVKGLYVIIPAEHRLKGSIPAEQLVPIMMDHLKADYYVSLLSGASYYGSSHQKSGKFQVISNKRIKHSLSYNKVEIELIYKKNIPNLALKDITVNTGYLRVGYPELIAIDLLKYPEKSGGLNHIATVLTELVDEMDADRLIQIADLVGEKACLQRLGYILEQVDCMNEENRDEILGKLADYLRDKMKVCVKLVNEKHEAGFPRIKKWKIVANTVIESDL